jgi:hypothetical protein
VIDAFFLGMAQLTVSMLLAIVVSVGVINLYEWIKPLIRAGVKAVEDYTSGQG